MSYLNNYEIIKIKINIMSYFNKKETIKIEINIINS